MRCADCSKFVSMENGEPEINGCEASYTDGVITVSLELRHTRNCADCGTELKDRNDTIEETIELDDLKLKLPGGDEAKPLKADLVDALKVGLDAGEVEVEAEAESGDVNESGGGRYAKNMIEIVVPYTLTFSGGKFDKMTHEGEFKSKASASEYEECC